MSDFITSIVEDYYKTQEKLTKEQFQKCLEEALSTGDFIRLCTIDGGTKEVNYEPFRRAKELESDFATLVDNYNKAIETLKFYAEKKHWTENTQAESRWGIFYHDIIHEIDSDTIGDDIIPTGGVRARKVLEELGESEED